MSKMITATIVRDNRHKNYDIILIGVDRYYENCDIILIGADRYYENGNWNNSIGKSWL